MIYRLIDSLRINANFTLPPPTQVDVGDFDAWPLVGTPPGELLAPAPVREVRVHDVHALQLLQLAAVGSDGRRAAVHRLRQRVPRKVCGLGAQELHQVQGGGGQCAADVDQVAGRQRQHVVQCHDRARLEALLLRAVQLECGREQDPRRVSGCD